MARTTPPYRYIRRLSSHEHSFIHSLGVPDRIPPNKMSQFPTRTRGYVERTVALLSQRDGVDKVCGYRGLSLAARQRRREAAKELRAHEPNPADPTHDPTHDDDGTCSAGRYSRLCGTLSVYSLQRAHWTLLLRGRRWRTRRLRSGPLERPIALGPFSGAMPRSESSGGWSRPSHHRFLRGRRRSAKVFTTSWTSFNSSPASACSRGDKAGS